MRRRGVLYCTSTGSIIMSGATRSAVLCCFYVCIYVLRLAIGRRWPGFIYNMIICLLVWYLQLYNTGHRLQATGTAC
jgi:hypothetical protein